MIYFLPRAYRLVWGHRIICCAWAPSVWMLMPLVELRLSKHGVTHLCSGVNTRALSPSRLRPTEECHSHMSKKRQLPWILLDNLNKPKTQDLTLYHQLLNSYVYMHNIIYKTFHWLIDLVKSSILTSETAVKEGSFGGRVRDFDYIHQIIIGTWSLPSCHGNVDVHFNSVSFKVDLKETLCDSSIKKCITSKLNSWAV